MINKSNIRVIMTSERILVIGQNRTSNHNDALLYFKFYESKMKNESETVLASKLLKMRNESETVLTSKILWLDNLYPITKEGVLRSLDWLLSSATIDQFLDSKNSTFSGYPLLQHTRIFLAYVGDQGYPTDDQINHLLSTRMNDTSQLFGCIESKNRPTSLTRGISGKVQFIHTSEESSTLGIVEQLQQFPNSSVKSLSHRYTIRSNTRLIKLLV